MKDDEKRRALKSAVKRELRPLMRDLGFSPDKRPFENRLRYSIGGYVREREGWTDEIFIIWSTYGRPSFMIEFWTDRPGRMQVAITDPGPLPHPNDTARIYPRRYGRFRPCVGEPWYGRQSVEEAMRVAKLRLAELDSFLQTGEPVTHFNWF
jgi:hypothetical protein